MLLIKNEYEIDSYGHNYICIRDYLFFVFLMYLIQSSYKLNFINLKKE